MTDANRPTMAPITSRLVAIVTAAAVIAMAALAGAPAGATANDLGSRESVVDVGMVVEARDTWTAPGDRFAARVAFGTSPNEASIEVNLHPAVTGRLEFAATVRDEQLGQPIVMLDPIAVDGARSRVIVIPGSEDGEPPRPPGVYPLSITLLDRAGEPIEQLVTHLIQLGEPEPDFPPLALGVLFDLGADSDLDDEDKSDALTIVGRAALDHPDIPMSVRLDPRQLADDRAPAELTNAAGTIRLVPETFVATNAGDWAAAGIEGALGPQQDFADQVFVDQLGREPDRDVVVIPARADQITRDWHRARGATGLITSEAALTPLDPELYPVTVARPFRLSPVEDLSVLTVDPVLRSALGSGHTPASTVDGSEPTPAELARRPNEESQAPPLTIAHRVLAELMVIWGEQPSRRRGVVLSPPPDLRPDAEVLGLMFDHLQRAPSIIEPIDLAAMFDTVPAASTVDEQPLVRELVPTRVMPLAELATGLARTEQVLGSYAGLVGADDPRLQPLRRRQLDAGDPTLNETERGLIFDDIERAITGDLGGVSLPDGQRITLTSREAELPLTLRKEREGPVTVLLTFASQKLEFVDGPTLLLELVDDQTELSIPVQARASGEFPLEITATSPDGRLDVATASLVVRSTAFSGVGLLLSAGALTFLVVWWGRNARASRRDRRLVDEPEPRDNDYGDDAVSLPTDRRNAP